MTTKKPYTISQLCKDFNRTSTTIGRKIKKYKFEKEKNYVNGRLVNIVYLTDEQYSALRQEIELVDESITSISDTNLNNSKLEDASEEPVEHPTKNTALPTEEVSLLVQEVVKLSKLVQDQSMTSKELIDRVINAEKQVLLLTDVEKRKDDEYNQLVAENKELKAKLAKKPWMFWKK